MSSTKYADCNVELSDVLIGFVLPVCLLHSMGMMIYNFTSTTKPYSLWG